MSRLQEQLQQAGRDLGIRVITPYDLRLANGKDVHAQAMLPQLVGHRGMIVVSSLDDIQNRANDLMALGYGWSVLDEPSAGQAYDAEGYIDMFKDWGWGSPDEACPDWIKL